MTITTVSKIVGIVVGAVAGAVLGLLWLEASYDPYSPFDDDPLMPFADSDPRAIDLYYDYHG